MRRLGVVIAWSPYLIAGLLIPPLWILYPYIWRDFRDAWEGR